VPETRGTTLAFPDGATSIQGAAGTVKLTWKVVGEDQWTVSTSSVNPPGHVPQQRFADDVLLGGGADVSRCGKLATPVTVTRVPGRPERGEMERWMRGS
jgi:hypothetical protein